VRGLLLTAVLAALAVSHAGAAPPVDGLASLARALELVDQAESAPPSLRASLAAEAVRVLDAPDVPGRRWLQEPLRADPPNILQARSRLLATRQVLGISASPPSDPEAAQARLLLLLSQPPFKEADWIDSLPVWLRPGARSVRTLYERGLDLIRWPIDRLVDLLFWLLRGLYQARWRSRPASWPPLPSCSPIVSLFALLW